MSTPTLAEIKAEVQALKTWVGQKDHTLAQEVALAISQPFPDQLGPSQGCDCVFGPRCESGRNCVDENATAGVKDRRTGEIRKRARRSFFHPWWTRGPAPRVVFYCLECFEELKVVWGTPIAGITLPKHASEFWQPSLADHVRLTAMQSR